MGRAHFLSLCLSLCQCAKALPSPKSTIARSLPQVLSPTLSPWVSLPNRCPAHLLTILFFLGSLSLHPLEGKGSWDLEEGRNPEFLRGVEARRGGGELGAGCLGTKQEAGFLVSPPTGPAHPCQLPPVLFSHPNCLLDLSFPRVAETRKSSSSSSSGGV